jgi:hypothetical protein
VVGRHGNFKEKGGLPFILFYFLSTMIENVFYSNMPWKNIGEYGCVENLQSFFMNVCMFEVLRWKCLE